MTDTITNSCHCGAVTFEITGKPKLVVNCHCNACKKSNGGVFTTYVAVSDNDFTITQGEDSLKQYIIIGEGIKNFCTDCGSPIYNKNDLYPGLLMLFYGTLSNSKTFAPTLNIYCESRHDWLDSVNELKSFRLSIER